MSIRFSIKNFLFYTSSKTVPTFSIHKHYFQCFIFLAQHSMVFSYLHLLNFIYLKLIYAFIALMVWLLSKDLLYLIIFIIIAFCSVLLYNWDCEVRWYGRLSVFKFNFRDVEFSCLKIRIFKRLIMQVHVLYHWTYESRTETLLFYLV